MQNKEQTNVQRELNLTTISFLTLIVKLLILIFNEIIYSLRYNVLVTKKWDV